MKHKLLFLIAFLSVALTFNAQARESASKKKGINNIYVSYDYINFISSEENYQNADSWGASVAYSHINFIKRSGLFVEYGARFSYLSVERYTQETMSTISCSRNSSFKSTYVTIPINIGFRFGLGKSFGIYPYLGANAKANVSAKQSNEYKFSNSEDVNDNYSLFDNDKTWQRCQVGVQAGLKVNIKNLLLGFEYCADMTDFGYSTFVDRYAFCVGLSF